MREYQNIIIGFGKGGKTLAGALAADGQTTALIERSEKRYGGTCINVACIPTKSLEYSARLSFLQEGDFEKKAERYQKAVEEKNRLTAMLRKKNYEKLVAAGVQILTGEASFSDSHRVKVVYADGTQEEIYGKKIFINTGAKAVIPPIEGVLDSSFCYTSETLMERECLPRKLVIIGGGYIGLEFASYFLNFGSEVTMIQNGEIFIPREDREMADFVQKDLLSRKADILKNAHIKSVRDEKDHAFLTLEIAGKEQKIEADAILIATGRKPDVLELHLENAGVELTERGAVKVNEYLQTSVPHIWAMGDVVGGLQFTYISMDDSRIVREQLLGEGKRTTENRGFVPYTVFLDPPLSRVGLSEEEAREQGYEVKIARLLAAAIPKAQVMHKSSGFLKAIIDGQTGLILGAHLFCAESHEVINLIKLAMDAKIPYTALRDSIFTHPTMSEALNDLFSSLS